MIRTLLCEMLEETANYHRDTSSLMRSYVADRLDKSFNEYNRELNQGVEFLTKKHEKSIIKRMKRMNDELT